MPFTGSYICASVIIDAFNAKINFASDVFKIALYTNSATLNGSTTAYTATGELGASGGYTTGGLTIAGTITLINTPNGPVPVMDFADAVWTNATFSNVRGALIYDNTHVSKPAIMVIDFGMDRSSISPASFRVTMPTNDANNGLITFPIGQAV